MTEKTPEKKYKKEISAGFIVFRKEAEGIKFLLLYHGHNYWNFPKGKIESEERSLEAAFRETKEEAGLGKNDLRMVSNFKVYQKFSFRRRFDRPGSSRLTKEQMKEEPQNIFKIVIFYLAETRNPNIKVSSEHQGYAWFLYPEAMKIMVKYKGNQKILKQAYDYIHPVRGRSPMATVNQQHQQK
ncbi:MAG TPA: NUDIX domain-containing protein [Candidatus Paceibacterota bacterium]|nr:NUDIX domain-containing protein [Candidatus Paceibacterota bacterium]